MPIRVQLPDGKIAEFPDGTPQEQMAAALKSYKPSEPTYEEKMQRPLRERITDPSLIGEHVMRTTGAMLSPFKRENLPGTLAAVGGAAATAATGGLALPAVAALGGGALGEAIKQTGYGSSIKEAAPHVLKSGAFEGALSAAPGAAVGLTRAAAPVVKNLGKRAVLADVTSAMGVIRDRAGKEGTGLLHKAQEIADTISEGALRTPGQAEALLQQITEQVRQKAAAATAAGKTLSDLPGRITTNINKLAASAEDRIFPKEVREGIAGKTRELLADSPLTRDVPKFKQMGPGVRPDVADPWPHIPRGDYEQDFAQAIRQGIDEARSIAPTPQTLRGPGAPQQWTGPQSQFPRFEAARELNPDITPSRAFDIIEEKSFFGPKEVPEGAEETAKQIELALRDAFKETADVAGEQAMRGRLIDAKRVLDPVTLAGVRKNILTPMLTAGIGTLAGEPLTGIGLGLGLNMYQRNRLGTGLALQKIAPVLQELGKKYPPEMVATVLRGLMQAELSGGGEQQP